MLQLAKQDRAKLLLDADFLCAAHQRLLEIVICGLFVAYTFYVLMLGKMFSPSVSPAWYRDLGILWDLADHVVHNKRYDAGYYFPPSNAILVHAYGLLGRDIAFRIYLVLQVVALAVAVWAWARLIRLTTRPSRSLIVLTAYLTTFVYS